MTDPETMFDSSHNSHLTAILANEAANNANVGRALPLTPRLSLFAAGSSGIWAIRKVVMPDGSIKLINQDGNKMIDAERLSLGAFVFDAYSPEAQALLKEIGDKLTGEFEFLALSRQPVAGDALRLWAEFNRHMQESPEMRSYMARATKDAAAILVVCSLSSSAGYAVTSHLLDNPESYRSLICFFTAPSSQVNETDFPIRKPGLQERWQTLIKKMNARKDFGIVAIHSERIVGSNTGDFGISPSLEDSATATIDIVHRWLVAGALYGTPNARNHAFDLEHVLYPAKAHVVIPAVGKQNPSAEQTIINLLGNPLATGWKNPVSIDVLGNLEQHGQNWEEAFGKALLSLGLKGNPYHMDIPDTTILGMVTVEPTDALGMMAHLT